jgi:hypothetical protein
MALIAPINRNLAIGLEAFDSHYSFKSSAVLPAGWPRELRRPGIRAQVTSWLPLLEHKRKRDAAR